MKNQILKKTMSLLVAFTMILSISTAVSAFSDVPANASYQNALNRLTSLGIITTGSGTFNPNSFLTREQFAKMIIVAAGLEDTAASLKGSTIFSDIKPNSWSSGYINAAVDKYYITGLADGKFHPTDSVTFAQMCTVLVRALGYTSQDITGMWPGNYIAKANVLGLTSGISLKSSDIVPRWIAAVMIDNLLNTDVKNTGSASQTFIEATGFYTKCIILDDSKTLSSLSSGQILTDKGVFYNSTGSNIVLGSTSYLLVKNNKILKASVLSSSSLKVAVDQVSDNKVSYKNNGTVTSIVLPSNITYYYQGAKLEYSKVASLLQKNSSIVFNYDENNTVFEYAVVFDPVYSKPEIANSLTSSSAVLGSIGFTGDPIIIKDGVSIDKSQIIDRDVVYQVTDIWGTNKYIVVVDNKIGGKITAIKPSTLSPQTLQIDSVDYSFSKDFDFSKIVNANTSSIAVDSSIVVSLGIDGKIVNVENFGAEDNSGYAVVLDNSNTVTTDLSGARKYAYSAKLLFSDGVTSTYTVNSNAYEFRGKFVKYKFTDSQTISLEAISYNFPNYTTIKKDEHMLDSTYVADNVKIFNVVYNDSGEAVQANLLSWKDLPNGSIPQGKIWYTNTYGAFDDINVIFTDDIFSQRYQTGVIKAVDIIPTAKGSSYSYTIFVDGKEYKYTKYIDASTTIGSVYEFKMTSSGIESTVQGMSPITGTNVQAVDSRRIKLKDAVYYLNNNVNVYYKDIDGTLSLKTLADIDLSQTYSRVALYMDPATGSDHKVEVILLYE